jgi:hypothetical protein
MTQQTYSGPGTAMAEPPAPILPPGFDDEDGASDSRRKLMLVGAVLGVLVLGVVAFFLLKGGSSSSSESSFVVPPHHKAPTTSSGPAGQGGTVKLPKIVTAPAGRDPFKALYTPPVAAASTPPKTSPSTPATTVVPGTSNGTSAPPAASFAPVWIQLTSVNGTSSATFVVGYSNGKALRTTTYKNVTAPTNSLRTDFGNVFSLLSIQDGEATVQFGDGSPFDLLPGGSHRHPLG